MEDLETLKDQALNERIRAECILVTLRWTDRKEMTPKMTFKVDYREVEGWKRKLLEKGERFSMVDMRTGDLIFETHKFTEETT